MSYEIVMPRLGWNMEEGTLVEWLKKDGETVTQGDPVCTIEGDKAATDIESFESGVLKIADTSPLPGDTVLVGTLLGYIVTEGGPSIDNSQSGDGTADKILTDNRSKNTSEPALSSTTERTDSDSQLFSNPISEPTSENELISRTRRSRGEPMISPRARRLATKSGIDWRSLKGSGRMGRIVEKDVLKTGSCQKEESCDEPIMPINAIRSRRGTIADRMVKSHQTTAPVTLNTEVDVTKLSSLFFDDFRPSWYVLMAKISGLALTEHPLMNATWKNGIVTNQDIHVGIALDTPDGVIVPVIRDITEKSVEAVAEEAMRLTNACKAGKLELDQIQGGTFTITNLGMYEIDHFTPILHLPQCAILGLGRVNPRVIVLDEPSASIGIRKIMSLSLTFDHRIVDGAPAARFLQRIKQLIEEPDNVFHVENGAD